MKIYRRLNNNVVVVKDEKGNEEILMGCGLGFEKKVGDSVEAQRVEKTFRLSSKTLNMQFQELLVDIPLELIEIGNEIVDDAKIQIDASLNENLIISLTDHIHMAIERLKNGVEVKNVMLWDIKRFYQNEYKVGLHALEIIYAKLGHRLSEDEAGFIAFHIVNAQLDEQSKSVKEITVVMQEIENIVRFTFHIELNENSVYYYRFITHLKFFAQRLFTGKCYEDDEVTGLLDSIKSKYKEAYTCVLKIMKFIEDKYSYVLSEEEILYLSIHIARIARESKKLKF